MCSSQVSSILKNNSLGFISALGFRGEGCGVCACATHTHTHGSEFLRAQTALRLRIFCA